MHLPHSATAQVLKYKLEQAWLSVAPLFQRQPPFSHSLKRSAVRRAQRLRACPREGKVQAFRIRLHQLEVSSVNKVVVKKS